MSFQLDIHTIMTTDTSLNNLVEDVCFEVLPENYDITKDWVVYSFKKNAEVDCLKGSAYANYSVYIRILSPDTVKINMLGDYIQELVDDSSSGGIYDIEFVGDNHGVDLDKGQYSIVLEFLAIYI